MTLDPLPIVTNLGIAGFALWVMYKMYLNSSARFKEKDIELIQEIDKRDRRNERAEEAFRVYAREVQNKTTEQMIENTKVLSRVMDVLGKK